MRFSIQASPPPIVIKAGPGENDSITLTTRYMTTTERLQVVEALQGGLYQSVGYANKFITGWTGVENESGSPILLDTTFELADGTGVSAVDLIFGRLPLSKQIQIWATQLAVNGVDLKKVISNLPEEFMDSETKSKIAAISGPLGKSE